MVYWQIAWGYGVSGGGMLASAGFRGSLRIGFLQSFGLHSAVMGALVFVRDGVLRERCLLWSFKTFQIPNFLRSYVLSRSASHEATRMYHVYK